MKRGVKTLKTSIELDLRKELSRARDLVSKIDKLADQIMQLHDRVVRAEEARDAMAINLHEIKDEVQQLIRLSNRWKGGFIMLAGLGGITGWILTSWESIIYIFVRK